MRQCVTAVEGCRARTQCEERCEDGGLSIHHVSVSGVVGWFLETYSEVENTYVASWQLIHEQAGPTPNDRSRQPTLQGTVTASQLQNDPKEVDGFRRARFTSEAEILTGRKSAFESGAPPPTSPRDVGGLSDGVTSRHEPYTSPIRATVFL